MFSFRNVQVTSLATHPQLHKELHAIFSATLNPNISEREFLFYYMAHRPHLIDICFVENEDKKVVGFISAAYYYKTIAGEKMVVCKTAIGMLAGLRGGYMPMKPLFEKFMHYKITHLREKLVIAICLANPIMYAMICKNSGVIYPKPGVSITPKIAAIRSDIIKSLGLERRQQSDMVIKIHFRVKQCEANLKRIYSSNDPYIKHYLEQKIDFQDGDTLFVTVPVTLPNILVSIWKVMIKRPVKKTVKQISEKIAHLLKKRLAH